METYTTQEAQDQFASLLKMVLEERRHLRVATEEGAVVVLPEETYRNLAVTLELLSTTVVDNFNLDEEMAQEAVS